MVNQTILIIRHADKPEQSIVGVDETGAEGSKSLTPRGWQRAGIWAELFDPSVGHSPSLPTPAVIFASAPASQDDEGDAGASKSKRPLQTVSPLAAKLGIDVNLDFSRGQEAALAETLSKTSGVVLISWQHEAIAEITSALVPDVNGVPQSWPSDRFNVVLRFDRPNQSVAWSFNQIIPHMLAQDADTKI